MFPKLAIDNVVPPSILRDIQREVSKLEASGAKNLLIQIPVEDFAVTMDEVCKHVFYPFSPVLCGQPAAPWEKSFVGVMAQMDNQQRHPIIIGADGKEYEVT